MNIEELADAEHAAILGMLPPDLYDFSSLETGVAKLTALVESMPFEIPAGVAVEDLSVSAADGAEIGLRVYRPNGATTPAPLLYWMHGGGLVLGSARMDDDLCVQAALELELVVVSVDYRLAPAHPYPTPVDDCELGLRWAVDNASTLGIDPNQIIVAGGSAGGGLAASLGLRLAGSEIRPLLQLLRYPMLDDRNTTVSSHALTDGRAWNRQANVASWHAYLGDAAGTADVSSDAAPSRAGDLAGSPSTIITVGALDMFVDECMEFAKALIASGVATELHVYPGAFHGADKMLPDARVTKQMRQDEFDAIRNALTGAT